MSHRRSPVRARAESFRRKTYVFVFAYALLSIDGHFAFLLAGRERGGHVATCKGFMQLPGHAPCMRLHLVTDDATIGSSRKVDRDSAL